MGTSGACFDAFIVVVVEVVVVAAAVVVEYILPVWYMLLTVANVLTLLTKQM